MDRVQCSLLKLTLQLTLSAECCVRHGDPRSKSNFCKHQHQQNLHGKWVSQDWSQISSHHPKMWTLELRCKQRGRASAGN